MSGLRRRGKMFSVFTAVWILLLPIFAADLAVFKHSEISYELADDSPIEITSNSDFAFTASIKGWSGNGSSTNPYVLDGLRITSDYALEISNTNAHFVVQDSTLGEISAYITVRFINVENGVIISSTLVGQNGLWMEYCDNIAVYDTTCSGIIHMSDSSTTDFANNFIGRLDCFYSGTCTVVANEIYDLNLYECDSFTIEDNEISYGAGIYGGRHDVTGNTVLGRPWAYFQDLSDSTIDCSNYGTVSLAYCERMTLKNGWFHGTKYGIYMRYSSNCTITENSFSDNMWAITIAASTGASIYHNTINQADRGVYFWQSHNCSIEDNRISECEKGIRLIESGSSKISSNELNQSDVGVESETCSNFTITKNTFVVCRYAAIDLLDCNGFRIYENLFGWNGPPSATDSGGSNFWDNGLNTGNNWSSYNGVGTYSIDGSSGSCDNYPSQLIDSIAPSILEIQQEPIDIAYGNLVTVNVCVIDDWGLWNVTICLSTDNNRTWNNHLMRYDNGLWEFSTSALNVSFNYRVCAYDWSGNLMMSDIIINSVENVPTIPNPTSSAPPPTNTWIGFGLEALIPYFGFISIVVIIVIIISRRRR